MNRTRPRSRDVSHEARAQEKWKQAGIFRSERHPGRPKYFIVELPPFANGALHLGHLRNYTMGDVAARFRRMRGHDVLYAIGFDAFGLPNENAALAAGCPPAVLVERNMGQMLRLFERLGLSYDPGRRYADHDPEYYRWVQWIFVRLFAAGHIYRRHGPVHWCPTCRSTLADSLVEHGRCWRCASMVDRVAMDRWCVREADFAEPLLADDDNLPGWPDWIKQVHRDWIGRRIGVEITYRLKGDREADITAFADSPELVEDAKFLSVGVLHPLAATVAGETPAIVPGVAAVDPLSQRLLPVVLVRDDARVADGEVAIGCPRRNAQDRQIWRSLWPDRQDDDEPSVPPRDPESIVVALTRAGAGRTAVRYRLRDWDIARPRYWGTPIPVIHCRACGPVAVPERELPVVLPDDVDLTAAGAPLTSCASFMAAACPRCGAAARRDSDTIETYASPWWYYLICRTPGAASPFDAASSTPWMPVDLMIGGADQARTCFFHLRTMAEALVRLGIVAERHPVKRLIAVGLVKQDGRKMSKSAGNAVEVADLLDRHGADALRLAVLSTAAPGQDMSWSDDLLGRATRWLDAAARLCSQSAKPIAELPAAAPQTTKPQRKLAQWVTAAERKITGSLDRCAFHVAVQQLTFLLDQLVRFQRDHPAETVAFGCAVRSMLVLMAPLAPHLAEHLWEQSGGAGVLAAAPWPLPPERTDD